MCGNLNWGREKQEEVLTKATNLLENLYFNELSRFTNFKDHIYVYDWSIKWILNTYKNNWNVIFIMVEISCKRLEKG